ncbi:MAG: SigB/SigF/SigG family RNA polymerase sigma factor [Clostridia bacterium]|nr:SigB/SigF/SigG family RNA polymerase sigma factor [Clostridia bacterium]
MNNINIKVEIQGVDTSKLPRLSQQEQMDMLKRIKNGETYLKDKFVEANLRLVLSIIKKFNNRGENINDIFQVGVVGLIKAIDNFDITQPVQFSTYAVPMIIGEIKRYLRDNSAFRVTRSLRDLAYTISQEREKYINEKNEEPTVDEICKITGAAKEDVILALDSMIVPMSIYDSVYNDGGDQIFLLDQLKNEKEDSEELINKIAIEQMLEKLNDKEKDIIKKRYFQDVTQIELAEELGVSQAQISRIEKNALNKLKRKATKE